jgi:hypothetical protein
MAEESKALFYELALKSPRPWLVSAYRLKRSAEKIFCWKYKNDRNSPEGDLYVHELLLGLSFENLLKGIVAAQRGSAGSDGKMDNDLTTHDMGKLVKLIDSTKVSISDSEKKVLIDLKSYVDWAGRYPIPKKVDGLFDKVHSYEEYKTKLLLWDRLFNYLNSVK